MFKRFAIVAAASAMTMSCSAGQDIAASEQAVDQFHRAFNEGRYGEIYSGATSDITNGTTAQAWNDMLAGVKAGNGNVRSSQRNGFNVNYNNGAAQVQLTYDTEFEASRGTERFVFAISNGRAQLAGYHFNRTSGGRNAPPAEQSAPAQPAPPAAPAEQPAPAGGEGDKPSE